MPNVRVATFEGPGAQAMIREVPKPEVPRKAALIRIAACGVCGTDLHILKGHWHCVHYPETANKCLTLVYYGRYLGFEKPPHLWGGWSETVYVDLDELPGTKIYKLPDDMPLALGALSEPLTSCVRAFDRAQRVGFFRVGDTVVIQGSGPIGVLAVAAAQEMGAGRVIVVGAPENPRLALCRRFGARPPSRSRTTERRRRA